MQIRHKQQRSGRVSVSGYSFTVLDNGVLDPEPDASQAAILLNFSSLFELLGEDGEPVKEKIETKTAPKAAPKRAARRGKK